MRKLHFIMLVLIYAFSSKAQQANCNFKPPFFTIHFGSGQVSETNNMVPARYARVGHYCPSDGHYTFTPNTSDCFRGDWFNLSEDHTPGDKNGNMLLINSSYRTGVFFSTSVSGLKGNTTYEFSVWMMNVCKITEKCPFPLLPDITFHLQTPAGKNVAQLAMGELDRVKSLQWRQIQFVFTTPPETSDLQLIMVNSNPGGCGNDFVMDDITFRECVIPPPAIIQKKTAPPARKQVAASKPAVKNITPAPVKKVPPKPVAKAPEKQAAAAPKKSVAKTTNKPATKTSTKPATKAPSKPLAATPAKPLDKVGQQLEINRPKNDSTELAPPPAKQRALSLPPPPAILKSRTTSLVKTIVTGPGEIRIDLYDNGEIDDDTVSIYHNNRLLASRARLSQKAITFRIMVDDLHPHHEFVMVANNLGSIPPNTSLMIVTAGDKRHEVFISSTKQKNAKVVLDLE